MDQRTIRVRGSAEVSGAPDWVIISFSISSRNLDYGKSMEQLAQQTENLREELSNIGLERDNLKTYQFSIDTDFDWVKNKRVFNGYKASHMLRVEFPFEKDYLNKVLRVLSNTQSQASFHISFEIKDPEPLRQQAIAKAVENAGEKARVLAEAGRVALGEIIQIDYSWSEIHFRSSLEIHADAAPMSAPDYDVTPEDVDVSDSVTVIYSIHSRLDG